MAKRSGRKGTGNRTYRKHRAELLANNDICALCGHDGARTADHIITKNDWLAQFGTLDGFDDPENLQPAHGTMGIIQVNRCSTCNQLCNQARGQRPVYLPHSRQW